MFNKIPRKSYILMLLVFALSMMVFPFDVAMDFSAVSRKDLASICR